MYKAKAAGPKATRVEPHTGPVVPDTGLTGGGGKGSARYLEEQARRAAARRCSLRIDGRALGHNLGVIKDLSPGAKVMAVVKGNAYGLGAREVVGNLVKAGVRSFAVDNVAEAMKLRAYGLNSMILVLDGDVPENAPLAVEQGLTPGIATIPLLKAYNLAAEKAGIRHRVWLYHNSGFNRSGTGNREKFEELVRYAKGCKWLEVRCLYTHLARSHGDGRVSVEHIKNYFRFLEAAREILGASLESSIFASHGLVRWGNAYRTDWVRPGLLLYGEDNFTEELVEPEALEKMERFKPAVNLKARIIHILQFKGRESVGYGADHLTRPGQRLATVAIGYGNGFPPGAHKGYLLINGKKARLFGATGMDYLQTDITGIEGVREYGWATVLGAENGERVKVKTLARNAGITPYVLLRKLNLAGTEE